MEFSGKIFGIADR